MSVRAGQPPVEPESTAEHAEEPEGLADDLAHQGVKPLTERVHVIGEPRHQLGRALVGEAGEVEVDRAPEEHVADVEEGQLHDRGDQGLLQKHEESLERDADHDESHQEQKTSVTVVRQILVDIGLGEQIPREYAVAIGLFLGDIAKTSRDRGGPASVEQAAAFPQLSEPPFGEADAVSERVELNDFTSRRLADVVLQLGDTQGMFAGIEREGLGFVIFVQDVQALFERLENPLTALRNSKGEFGFDRARIENDDLVFDGVDCFRNPAFGVLAIEQDVQEGVDGPQLGEEEKGDHGGAADRQSETDPIAPREVQQANKISHVRGTSQTGIPREPPCVIGARG